MFLIAHQPSYKFSAPSPRIPLIWECAQGIVLDFTKTLHPLTQLQLTQSWKECVRVYSCNSASSQPQSWEAMTRAQWVHTIDTAGDLRRHIAVPRLSCLSGAHAGSINPPLRYSLLNPVFFFLFSSWEQKELEVWLSMKMTSSTERNGHC